MGTTTSTLITNYCIESINQDRLHEKLKAGKNRAVLRYIRDNMNKLNVNMLLNHLESTELYDLYYNSLPADIKACVLDNKKDLKQHLRMANIERYKEVCVKYGSIKCVKYIDSKHDLVTNYEDALVYGNYDCLKYIIENNRDRIDVKIDTQQCMYLMERGHVYCLLYVLNNLTSAAVINDFMIYLIDHNEIETIRKITSESFIDLYNFEDVVKAAINDINIIKMIFSKAFAVDSGLLDMKQDNTIVRKMNHYAKFTTNDEVHDFLTSKLM